MGAWGGCGTHPGLWRPLGSLVSRLGLVASGDLFALVDLPALQTGRTEAGQAAAGLERLPVFLGRP